MIIAYIAHPVSGDVDENMKKIIRIVRLINLTEPETVPFVPYYPDLVALNDDIPEERERGIKNDTAILSSGMVHEIRLYGDRISFGMQEEVKLGIKLGIEIKPMNSHTKADYDKLII